MSRTDALCRLAIAGLVAAGLGCSPASPKLVEKPKAKFEKVRDAGDTRLIFTPRVDILFVVDDSGSMMDHQSNLAANIQQFTNGIVANQLLDYHIGVITSTMDSWSIGVGSGGKLVGKPGFIDRNTPDGVKKLAKNLQVGISGSGIEKFFEPIRAALTPPIVSGENAGFYRQEAFLAVIFITDTDDQSTSAISAPQDFHNFLVDLKGDKDKVLYYAAYIPTADNKCTRSGEELPHRLEELFQIGGAKTFGLCDTDFGKKLTDVSADLVGRVGKTMLLSRPPDVKTIEVRYGEQVIPNDPRVGWMYDPKNNALIFGPDIVFNEQPAGTEVEVNFTAAEY